MHVRFRSVVALACLAAAWLMVPAASADSKAMPTFTLRLKSIDGLLSDAEFLAAAAGKENEAAQFGGLVRQQKGPKGLFGIDTTRPIGAYANVSQDIVGSTSVAMVPIADQESLLKQLEVFGIQPKKDNDGSYSLNFPGLPVTLYFKFANKYLYITAPSKDALAGDKLPSPADVFPAGEKSLLSAVWNLDKLPDNLRQMAIQNLEAGFNQERKREIAGETEAQRKLRFQILDEIARQLAAIIKEGARLESHLNVDQQKQELTADISFAAVAGSQLAKSITNLGRSQSAFGGVVQSEAALSLLMHVALPDALRELVGPVIDEGLKKEADKEKDAAKRALAEQFLGAIKPSLMAGELDTLLQVAASSGGKYDVVAAIKIKEGAKVAEALRAVVSSLPPNEKAFFELDAEKVGDVAIHRINAQTKFDAPAKQIFGENPLYVAVLPGSILVAAGPNGLKAIQNAAAAKPKAAPQFSLSVSARSLAPLLAHSNKKNAAFVPAAKTAFGTGKDNDTIAITVHGGNELKARLVVKAPVIRFLAEIAEKTAK